MLHIEFSDEQKHMLRDQRFNYPHPHVQRKMEALLLKSFGLPHKTIAAILDVDLNTLRTYFRDYLKGGIEQLKVQRWKGSRNSLSPHKDALKNYFLQHPPATVAQAAEAIAKLTGILRKPTQVRKLLKSFGMKALKMAALPAKADPRVQHEFLKKNSNPRWSRP